MSKAVNKTEKQKLKGDIRDPQKELGIHALLPGEEPTALTPDEMYRVLEKLEDFARLNPDRRGGDESCKSTSK